MDTILKPWPWYVTGPSIAIVMFLLLYFDKTFGMSSNLRTLCAMGGAGKRISFFKFNWKANKWNLTVVIGAIIGGYIAYFILSEPYNVALSETTLNRLSNIGLSKPNKQLLPPEIFSLENVFTLKNIILLIIGGFLVGFGARYAGGCTSGHGITGLSSLQLPSLIAIIGFFIGGLLMIHLFFPLIF